MHNEPSVSVSRDRHFGHPTKSVTIYRNRRSHLTEMTGHALPKSAVTMGRNTQPTAWVPSNRVPNTSPSSVIEVEGLNGDTVWLDGAERHG